MPRTYAIAARRVVGTCAPPGCSCSSSAPATRSGTSRAPPPRRAGTRVDVPCIEAALPATGLPFAKTEAHQHETLGWSYTKDGLLVMWKPREPGAIVILDQAVGTDAPPVAAFREHRDVLVAKLRESCGPFEALGPEDCARTEQCK